MTFFLVVFKLVVLIPAFYQKTSTVATAASDEFAVWYLTFANTFSY
jgi:hypothetical protein